MRSPTASAIRILLVTLAVAGAAACIIGPKQDDPEANAPPATEDSSLADTSIGENLSDSSPISTAEGGKSTDDTGSDSSAASDAACTADGDADAACSDAQIDAVADGAEGG